MAKIPLYKGVRIEERKTITYVVKSHDGKPLYSASTLRAAKIWIDGYTKGAHFGSEAAMRGVRK